MLMCYYFVFTSLHLGAIELVNSYKNYRVTHPCSTYQMTVLLLEVFVYWFRAACELWLVSSGTTHVVVLSEVPVGVNYK